MILRLIRPSAHWAALEIAMTVASAPEAYQEKLHFEALVFVSFSPFLEETRMCCTVFLHLALLTLTSH